MRRLGFRSPIYWNSWAIVFQLIILNVSNSGSKVNTVAMKNIRLVLSYIRAFIRIVKKRYGRKSDVCIGAFGGKKPCTLDP